MKAYVKKMAVCIMISCFAIYTQAQNLVPNPSFETYSACPSSSNFSASLATGWNVYGKTPDYLNACFPDSLTTNNFDVPNNIFGFQYPATGSAYAGIWVYSSNEFFREYIGAQLISPLQIGSTYQVSMKIAFSNSLAYGKVATNKFGLRFSNIPYSNATPAPTDNFAHVYTNTIVTDTLNWTTISSNFTADSAYSYVMLGNFFDDAHTDTLQIHPTPAWFSYYFLDDVYVGKISSPEGIDQKTNSEIRLYPNPSFGELILSGIDCQQARLQLVDVAGHSYDVHILPDENKIDIRHLNAGMYILKVSDKQKVAYFKFSKY